VVELVDTLALGASEVKLVKVQVLSSPPDFRGKQMSSKITDRDIRLLGADLYFGQAVEFHDACEMLQKNLDQKTHHSHVLFIDSLFGIELYLKAMLLYRNLDPPMSHSLKKLWKLILDDDKARILDLAVNEEYKDEILKILELTDEVYNSSRYVQGCYFDDPKYLLATMQALKEECSKHLPYYK
jgi:HEPN domain